MRSFFAARGLMGTVCFWGLLKNWFVRVTNKRFPRRRKSPYPYLNNRAALFFNIREPMPIPPYFLSRITTP